MQIKYPKSVKTHSGCWKTNDVASHRFGPWNVKVWVSWRPGEFFLFNKPRIQTVGPHVNTKNLQKPLPPFVPLWRGKEIEGDGETFLVRFHRSSVKYIVLNCATLLAKPLTHIVNLILTTEKWPSLWKVVKETVIPKKETPESYDQCQNISCSSMFLKLCESFLLDQLQEEVSPDSTPANSEG